MRDTAGGGCHTKKAGKSAQNTRPTLKPSTAQTVAASGASVLGFFITSIWIFLAPITAPFAAALYHSSCTVSLSELLPDVQGKFATAAEHELGLFFAIYFYWVVFCACLLYRKFPHAATVLKFQTFDTPWRYQ
ncbi:hypothetical protein MKEN_00279700 [Mycena kentingensis (nom. inval.)]|nr:hypothetical protein MKEN_00279700 [Mycena kentingensis (nom. inval.)]